jgi:hypothetical protein
MPRASLKPGQMIVKWQLGKGSSVRKIEVFCQQKWKVQATKPWILYEFIGTSNNGTPIPTSFLFGIGVSYGSRRVGVWIGIPSGIDPPSHGKPSTAHVPLLS